ncbi:MAG: hypothetical protein ACREC8_06100 [Limisphaerales bacterium]
MNNKISKEEFQKRRVELVAASQKLIVKWFGAIFGLFALIAIVLVFSRTTGPTITGILVVVGIVIFCFIIIKYSKDDAALPKKIGLICPACGISLKGLKAGAVAATNKCSKCGEEILS